MSCTSAIQAKGIVVNSASAGKHDPVVENDIKTLKSRTRTHVHALPFLLCRMLLIWLVLSCVSHLNMEPSSTSVNEYSPREIFLGRALNFKRDLHIGFGDYAHVQVPLGDSEYNTMESRTEGAIAVFATGNLQGSVNSAPIG